MNDKLDKVNSVVNKQTGGAQPVKAKTEPAQPAPQTDAAPTDQAAESPQNPSETDLVFKVGDRVEADPMRVSHWYKGTVIKIQQMSLGDVTGYVVRFDAVGDSDPAEYTVGNKLKWIRPLKQAPK